MCRRIMHANPMLIRLSLIVFLTAFAFGQEIPALVVTPSIATVLLGETRRFRAVDAMGNGDAHARWDSGSPDVELESEGAEAVLYFNGPGDYIIHAYGAGGSASATIHVLRAFAYAPGATKWSVESFNGCKTRQPVRAIPAPRSTNDVFMVDECPR